MDLGERVRELMDKKNVTQYEISKRTGISQTSLSKILNNITSKLNIKNTDLLSAYFGVSRTYLLTGVDDNGVKTEFSDIDMTNGKNCQVPLLPISAKGGSIKDFLLDINNRDFERITSPINDIDLAIRVNGEAMSPEYPDGSLILIKRINEKAFVQWGEDFVLDTSNGVVFRKILPAAREGNLHCIATNPGLDYPPFDISTGEILGIYKVLLCMVLK